MARPCEGSSICSSDRMNQTILVPLFCIRHCQPDSPRSASSFGTKLLDRLRLAQLARRSPEPRPTAVARAVGFFGASSDARPRILKYVLSISCAIFDHWYSVSMRFRAILPAASRTDGLAMRNLSLWAKSAASPRAKVNPAPSTTSRFSGTSLVNTPSPAPMASRSASERPSISDGSTKIIALVSNSSRVSPETQSRIRIRSLACWQSGGCSCRSSSRHRPSRALHPSRSAQRPPPTDGIPFPESFRWTPSSADALSTRQSPT